jgi:cobyric acid synthase
MITGMLWFDNSTATLDEKIIRAAIYYQQKYGKLANLCMVNPSMLGPQADQEYQVGKIKIVPYRSIIPNHFWLSYCETEEQNGSA